jgi:hypothetical protein
VKTTKRQPILGTGGAIEKPPGDEDKTAMSVSDIRAEPGETTQVRSESRLSFLFLVQHNDSLREI